MKKLFIAVVVVIGALGMAEARSHRSYDSWDTGSGSKAESEHVGGYTKDNGTYVAPYERTTRDNTLDNNYSTRGNENPWTGKTGTGQTDADRQGSTYSLPSIYNPK